jgi:YidC/Oxa1 family membrane protein insertase
MQAPIFYALFQFFPSAISLRQKGFLWADDLSSFDSIYELPFHVPLYGNHISLFPSYLFFLNMTKTTEINNMAAHRKDADMAKMMKI